MLEEIIQSAAQLLDAPVQRQGADHFIDVWVFLDPHDESKPARRQVVQLFQGEAGDLLYLSSTVGPYSAGMDLAPLLRSMIGSLHCSVYLSAPDADGTEHIKIASAVETSQLTPERLSQVVREVGVFADRFEAKFFGADLDVR